MQQFKSILVYGFALFAMFFGSGNLVFPIQIGNLSGSSWLAGFLGLFCTGIILPFLGLFVIKLYKGNYNSFFAQGGSLAKIALPLFTLSLLGAFGVVPRCITVAHGGMEYIFPQLPLSVFSVLFCLLTFYCGLRDKIMMKLLGKWMSPILLISLIGLIMVGIYLSDPISQNRQVLVSEAFHYGFLSGYQTMDLFAAFFFSGLTFKQIQDSMPQAASHKDIIKFAIKPSILAALLLSLIYLGFVFLGSHYASVITGIEAEFMLPAIAKHIMGESATFVIGITMLFSCLTTAVALNNIYARFLCSLFKQEDKFHIGLAITTAISFIISLLDFKGIASFLAPALEVSYPGIIALTILSILTSKYARFKIIVFYAITAWMIVEIIMS